jgi:hypothetical protein
MHVVVSTLFCVIRFPHQGKFVTVDQLSFFNSDSRTSNVPFFAKTPPGYENVGVGLLKDLSLMCMFPIPLPNIPTPFVTSINMISTTVGEIPESYDPWIIPSSDDFLRYDDRIPISLVELAYHAIQSTTPSPPSLLDMSPDPFHIVFHTNEIIMTIMYMEDTPWDDGHHRSILFLDPKTIESYQWISNPSIVVTISPFPEPIHDVLYEGNLGNISPIIPLDISIKPGVMENVYIGASCFANEFRIYKALFQEFCDVFAWSYKEMPQIDPNIVVHDIKTYSDAKLVR